MTSPLLSVKTLLGRIPTLPLGGRLPQILLGKYITNAQQSLYSIPNSAASISHLTTISNRSVHIMKNSGYPPSSGCESTQMCSHQCETQTLLSAAPSNEVNPWCMWMIQRRGFKVKVHPKLRCKYCYFARVRGRLEVKCTMFPRHKQKEGPFNPKLLW